MSISSETLPLAAKRPSPAVIFAVRGSSRFGAFPKGRTSGDWRCEEPASAMLMKVKPPDDANGMIEVEAMFALRKGVSGKDSRAGIFMAEPHHLQYGKYR